LSAVLMSSCLRRRISRYDAGAECSWCASASLNCPERA
jgi:hypothetical protein